jgi:hypothetical protein
MNEGDYKVAFGASRLGAAFIVLGGFATFALLTAISLPHTVKALAALWIGFAMLDAYRRVALRAGPRGVRAIVLRTDGEIEVFGASRGVPGRVCDGSFVAPWLTIIRWRPHGARFDRTVVVLPDMLGAAAFRTLRVRLKWQ